MQPSIFKNRRVLVTGHTGFKGSWLTMWLHKLGAIVGGFSCDQSDLFVRLGLSQVMALDERADVCDRRRVLACLDQFRPEFVFHLAAQALVRPSYETPAETFETNIMGTVNVLDAARSLAKPMVVVVVTSDKCYENSEWLHAYRETDPMGGFDPYQRVEGLC